MSLAVLADHMASKGRNGDTMLVHMAPEEVRGLHALAAAHGGELTINPETGLPEANFLKRLLPTIIGAALAATGVGAPMAALMVGGFEAVRTGDLGKGIAAGLGAYGGAGIGSALSSAGAATLAGSPEAIAAGQAAAGAVTPEVIAASNAALADAGMGASVTEASLREAAANEAARNVATQAPFYSKLGAGLQGLASEQGRAAFMQGVGGGKGLLKAGYMAAAPLLAAEATKAKMPQTVTSPTAAIDFLTLPGGRQGDYGTLQGRRYTPEEFARLGGFQGMRERLARGEEIPPPGAAKGGLMGMATGGVAFESGTTPSYQHTSMSPGMLDFAQHSEPVVRMADGGFTDERVAQALRESMGQGFSLEQSLGGAASKFGISQDQLTRAQALLNPPSAPAAGLGALAGSGMPNIKQFMDKTGADFSTASDLLYGVIGSNQDTRNWNAIMAAQDPVAAARQATADMYGGISEGTVNVQTPYGTQTHPMLRSGTGVDLTSDVSRRANFGFGLTPNAASSLGAFDPTQQATPTTASSLGAFDPTQQATPTAAQLAAQRSILNDPQAAALGIARSGVAQGLSNQQIADQVNSIYGKSFSAQNIADFLAANGITRALPVIPSTPAPTLFPGTTPGVVSTGEPFTPTVPTMSEVKATYEQGGGSTKMPTITDIKPTDRTYTYNQAFDLLQDYLKANPNALYGDVVAFARSKGIPDMQAKAAYTEFRFSGLTGGSKQAYDYLMGRGAYPVKPFVPGGGPISRSYAEAMGITGGYQNLKPVTFTTAPSGAKVSEAQRSELGNRFVNAQKTGDYSSFNTMLQDLKLTVEDLLMLYPALTREGIKEQVDKGYVKFVNPYTDERESESNRQTEIGGGASGGIAQGIPNMARGGLSSLAALGGAAGGGQFDLGGYSDGGRLLRGPGDGVSDSIPATIGGKRPARLADGEFVVPARIVSELGNGSTEAGARKLYAMMDRVQAARRKSIGKGKVAKNSRADKYLPA